MDSSRKSFKALSMAQPIKRQIDDTLNKLQLQKRKFLSLQRQQATLKQQIHKSRRQLNEAKLIEPKIRVKQNKNIQTNMSINNTDRLYLNTLNKISEYKVKIDVHRRQIQKYKKLSIGLQDEIQKKQHQNNQLEAKLLRRQEKNETVKDHLMEYRNINMKNTDQFKNSFQALHKSSVKEQNQRRKNQALRRGFQFQQLKNSKLVNLSQIQSQSNINQAQSTPKTDVYMTNSIPLVKQRVKMLIHNNKQKLKISQNYRKFGEQLQNMFQIMKQYKGRDDVVFIADQFVMKQKQLKKIEQYIGKLQNRLMQYQADLLKIKNSDQELKQQLTKDQEQQSKISQNHYIKLQNDVKQSIGKLREKEQQNTKWLQTINKILSPLIDGQQINRGNVDKILGMIQEKYFRQQKSAQLYQQKSANKQQSGNKVLNQPVIDEKQIKSTQSMELMSYDRLKQYAKQYITHKK